MPAFPARTGLTDTYPNPTVSVFKSAIGALFDAVTGLLGTDGAQKTALATLRMLEHARILNLKIEFSVASNALTVAAKTRAGATPSATDPCMVYQRSATAGAGDYNQRTIEAGNTFTVSSGSTLGHYDGVEGTLYWYLIDNSGALEWAVTGTYQGPAGIYSTTAEGGAGAADSGATMYSASARTNLPGVCVARTRDTQTTAGTWTAVPSRIDLWPFNELDTQTVRLNPRGWLAGLKLTNNGTDANNDIDIAAGTCRDSADAYDMTLASTLVKQLDASWASGTNAGGLFSGTKANSTWYHVHLIRKDSDGTIDAGFDTSLTAANKPAGWSAYRRLGSVRTNSSGNIIGFKQDGDAFTWNAAILDINTTTLSTTHTSGTLSVPTGLKVNALCNVQCAGASAQVVYLRDPDVTDAAPSTTVAPLGNVMADPASTSTAMYSQVEVRTNASSQVRYTSSAASTTLRIATIGWTDPRGRND